MKVTMPCATAIHQWWDRKGELVPRPATPGVQHSRQGAGERPGLQATVQWGFRVLCVPPGQAVTCLGVKSQRYVRIPHTLG